MSPTFEPVVPAADVIKRLRRRLFALMLCGALLQTGAAASQAGEFLLTNGPCVFQGSLYYITNVVPAPRSYYPPSANLPTELRRALLYFMVAQQYQVKLYPRTNLVFDHFFPESLNHVIYTNVIAHTNGKRMAIWSTRTRPEGWPAKPTQASWSPTSLIWGMKGFTALSHAWEGEGLPGQVPITALTRRHGYTRGHSMGPAGFDKRFAGKRVWFLTKDNRLIERKIVREVVRILEADRLDYTILLFDQDLPRGIEPMRVAGTNDVYFLGQSRLSFCYGAPVTVFMTEQSGQVSAGIPGFTVNVGKGGDSGSPNMLPMPGELVFFSGRNTSGPNPAMQADIDELCRLEGIDLRAYQLQWANLSKFPFYETAPY